jgi:hypothetical protein
MAQIPIYTPEAQDLHQFIAAEYDLDEPKERRSARRHL